MQGDEAKDADCFAHTLLKAQQEAGKYTFLVTEMNDGLGPIADGGDLHRDMAYGAAFMFHNIPLLKNLTLMSWWTFTDGAFLWAGRIAHDSRGAHGSRGARGRARGAPGAQRS